MAYGVCMTRFAGIVVCGGKSSRMGRPKAWLPFGDETLLQRVVRVLSGEVAPICVAAADQQELPPLPATVTIVRDELANRGPLAGLSVALDSLVNRADAAFVTSCDVPLLRPAVVRHLTSCLGDADAVIPRQESWQHPLTAVYRLSLAERCRTLVRQERLKMLNLVEGAEVRVIDVESLRSIDPQLLSFANLNTPEEYESLLQSLTQTERRLPR